MTPAELSSAKNWCSDHLHELLGFADSALSGFLVDVASRGSQKKRNGADDGKSVQRVMQTLREGGVNGEEEKLLKFARELCQRCGTGDSGGKSASIAVASGSAPSIIPPRQPATNAEMIKRAAEYSLMDMEEPQFNPTVSLIMDVKKSMSNGHGKDKKGNRSSRRAKSEENREMSRDASGDRKKFKRKL